MTFDGDILRKCWFLAGPTASGKSAAGLILAERIGAEIVALDSMSLYRGMDIGTAKPSPDDRRRIPHHLLDVIDPHEEYSLAQYVTAAERVCHDIVGRGRIPLFIGGTGLYLRGVLRGVFEGPPADWDIRKRWELLAESGGGEAVHRELQAVDPALAGRLHPRDLRRVIRGLEVFALTGIPLSVQQRQKPLPFEQRPRCVFWLSPDRDRLYTRIDRRVEAMFAEGLVEEVRGLLSGSQPLSRTARQALGYREVIEHLEGKFTLAEALHWTQTRTRQFAKRQGTWFRHLEECRAIPLSGEASSEAVAQLVEAASRSE